MADDTLSNSVARLQQLRQRHGWSQQRLADLLGVSFASVSRWERGRALPSPVAWRLFVQLEAGMSGGMPEQTIRVPDSLTEAPPADRLPFPASSFIGREAELAAVALRLDQTRLLTLTGAGGSGKTRLALEAARAVASAFPDGVRLVDLSRVVDAALVTRTLAVSLGVGEERSRPLAETVLAALQSQRLLLLLDNCEHLLNAVATLLETLLHSCPWVRVLATSREPIGIGGEGVLPVLPLGVPTAGDVSLGALARVEAVRLFVERAAARQPTFVLTDQNAAAVTLICRRLDGLPLALELAAARVPALSVAEIAVRLDDRFHLLTSGSRTAAPRHRTLSAAIDWSYQLLSADEQGVFARLSVFVGSFDLAAAEAVGSSAAPHMLDLLSRLVETSMVVAAANGMSGETRYRLLETLREFGREKLAASGQAGLEIALGRHAQHYLELAVAVERRIMTPDGPALLDALERDHAELLGALQWLNTQGEVERCLRLAGAMWRFWWLRGYWSEGRAWLDRGRRTGSNVSARTRATALLGAGILAKEQSDYAAARTALQDALGVYRDLGDEPGVAECLAGLGRVAEDQGGYAAAGPFYREALAIYRGLDDAMGIGRMTNNVGLLAMGSGDLDGAQSLFTESHTALERLGDRAGMASALNNLGLITCLQGELRRALQYGDQALQRSREVGSVRGIALTLANQGRWLASAGEVATAMPMLEEALAMQRRHGDRRSTAWTILWLAFPALLHGEIDRAADLYSEGLALARELKLPHVIAGSQLGQGLVAAARRELDSGLRHIEAAVAAFRDIGDRDSVGVSLGNLAEITALTGNAPRALALFEESGLRTREVGDRFFAQITRMGEGRTLRRLGHAAEARAAFEETLPVVLRQENHRCAIGCLEGLALLALDHGGAERAATLFGYTAARRGTLGLVVLFPWHEYDQACAAMLDALGPREYRVALAAGRSLTADAAAALALEAMPAAAAPAQADAVRTGEGVPDPEGLTSREREVLRRIASGSSNREIAEALGVSVRTIERHITNIYTKIGARGKADATAYAIRRGLVTAPGL
ncbi:MAG: tetratricopeptide repeat protein [Dehalococcoidia bacterium]